MNLAIDVINSTLEPILCDEPGKPRGHRHSLSSDQTAGIGPHRLVPESYWEEKWRVMNKEEDQKQVGLSKQVQNRIKGWAEKVKIRLSNVTRSHIRRNTADDLKARLEENEKLVSGNANYKSNSDSNNYNETGRSSAASNSLVIRNETGPDPNLSPSPSIASGMYKSTEDIFSGLPVSEVLSVKEVNNEDNITKSMTDSSDGTSTSGMFPWLWMSSKIESVGSLDKSKGSTSYVIECNHKTVVPETVNLKNLSQSMLENIEVIESAKNLPENVMEALNRLRKIGNLISEM
ncbi:hypothetical protein R6Q57_018987 [Mikania cordata]